MMRPPDSPKVIAILACHQRREMTREALSSFFDQDTDAPLVALSAVVVDDGSTDGTSEMIRREFPRAKAITGDGTLYWSGGMRLAEDLARSMDYEWLLWMNDDVVLDSGAIARLLAVADSWEGAIVVGAVRDPVTAETTYSGLRLSRWHPLRATRVEPGPDPATADTFNGNVVLVRRDICEAVGGIDRAFIHSAGDMDYGLRAKGLGFEIVVAPGHVGSCARGERALLNSPSLRKRWRAFIGPKGFPPRARARYLRRHGGAVWPLFWIAPYLKFALRSASFSSHRSQAGGARS
jgi:GT2 family glycosyltransferase